MMKRFLILLWLPLVCIPATGQALKNGMTQEQVKGVQAKVSKRLGQNPPMFEKWKSESERKVVLEKVTVNADKNRINLYCNNILAQISIREELLAEWEQMVRDTLGTGFEECSVAFFAKNIPAERYIPNLYRKETARDAKRGKKPAVGQPVIKRLDQPVFGQGLAYRHIAMWPSHGYYYDYEDGKWEWQRPSLFNVIEDLNTFDYVNTYLAPMLENAGAVLLMPRERDTQPVEIIADNDLCTGGAAVEYDKSLWRSTEGGFRWIETIASEDPFASGSYLTASASADNPPVITYLPAVGKEGEYAVYASWKPQPGNITNALYEVNYAGGTASFEVNQRMGGGWVYLGKFPLDSSSNVTLTGKGQGTVTADAVKIGGGMGNVVRGGTVSGMPRWAEGVRYWMQYSGVPSSIYAQDTEDKAKNSTGKPKDYNDDFKSRGDWCNYIRNTHEVPIDMAVAIHSNAGINDSIFGSLTINYTNNCTANYSDGSSKLAGRDMADIILTQIVGDMRALYTEKWTRRSLYDKSYAEVSRPDAPAVIVEMFSHQNFNDMWLSLDPRFKFDMSRAIYKGILRFLADRYSFTYAVQPLPPNSFRIDTDNGKIRITWKPTDDPLEPTAKPAYYRLYTRTGQGFDRGVNVYGTSTEIDIPRDGQLRSYRVTALNEGGESFPTEILSAGFQQEEAPTALIVNGFTKLSAPDTLKKAGQSGFDMESDPGVRFATDWGISGAQKNFDKKSEFVDNDSPGWGAATLDLEAKGLNGNTFDYTAKHARALMAAGYSVVSVSRQAFEQQAFRMGEIKLIDIVMGLQKSQFGKHEVYSASLLAQVEKALDSEVNILISGAYTGHDLSLNKATASKAEALTGVSDGGLTPNGGEHLELRYRENPLVQQPLTLPGEYSSVYCHLPRINLLRAANTSAVTIDGPAGAYGVVSKNRDTGTCVSLGFPLEALPQRQMNELVRNIFEAIR